jgi:outer membrane protein assembly factor BamB
LALVLYTINMHTGKRFLNKRRFRREKMKKNQNNLFSVALILLLSLSAVAILIPQVNAHTPAWTIPTYAYVVASPPTVGVGESTIIVMWLNAYPPTAGGTAGDMWRGFVIAVTAPDGSKSQLGPFTSGPVGTQWTMFNPTQVGTYTFVFSWPGQTLAATRDDNLMGVAYIGDRFEASTSAPATLTVTQNTPPQWQEPALPAGYWTRPINAQNREWSKLASNWLLGSWLVSNVQRWGTAPNSPHIVWTQPIAEQPGVSSGHPGGIADAAWIGQSYDTDDYQSPWSAPIVMNGIIYYNSPADAMSPRYGYYAMDLRTGEQLWYNNGTRNQDIVLANPAGAGVGPALSQTFPRLSFGQLMHYNDLNGQGIIAYLWMTQGTSWYMLDPDNGDLLMTLKNVPSGTGVTDQDGSILRYNYNATSGNVLAWNSSQAIPFGAPGMTSAAHQWRPRVGAILDAVNDKTWTTAPLPPAGSNGNWTIQDTYHTGYSMNTTIQKGLTGISQVLQDDNRVPRMFFSFNNPTSGYYTGGNGVFTAWAATINYGVSTYNGGPQNNSNLGQGVTLLWNRTYNPLMPGNLTYSSGPVDYINRIWTLTSKETMQWWGFSLDTGDLLWGPTASQSAWDMYGMGGRAVYGNLYSCGYGGILYCYDIKTGTLKWTYEAPNIGRESPYGNYPLSMLAFADGKVYLGSSEHSPTKPLWRGSFLRAVDAINGHEIWKIEHWVDGMAIADGYIVAADHYDNNIYCYGKGQTAVTVTAPEVVQTTGTAVLIKGTVTDQSPGAPGTPAISDAYMKEWMEYTYKQQAIPGNAQGVPVTLTAISESGSATPIGTATTDMSGMFKTLWTPTVAGAYTIIASFDGSNSYFPSYAEAALGIVQPAPTPAPTAVVAGPNILPAETFYAVAAVLAVLIIVVALLVLRKK